MELPIVFTEYMKKLLGDEYESYLASFHNKRSYGLRCNTLKVAPDQFEQIAPFSIRHIPWIKNGYFYEEDARPAKDSYYYAGLYYLQEPSAMTPANILPITEGDCVLDVCAAPGGKSTELAAKLNGSGFLLSNDISNSRARALLKNLEMAGAGNICVTSETPEKLRQAFGCYFDKILIDAPCSGEGMFRKDAGLVKSFLEHGPEYYVPIQKEIVTSAVHMLKPGGMILYSTCTFDVREDEEVILHILKENPDMKLVPLTPFEGAVDGIGLSGCIRLFPHKIEGEGHFVALLKKDTSSHGDIIQKKQSRAESRIVTQHIPDCALSFLKNCDIRFDSENFFLNKEQLYYLPEGFDASIKLRYLRTGLYLGDIKKDRFEPSQAFAMALKKSQYPVVLTLSHDDDRALRYLKGETLALCEEDQLPDKGWCLVCVEAYPLGWAKISGMSLKNKYHAGWRWQ